MKWEIMDKIQVMSDIVLVEPVQEVLEDTIIELVPNADDQTRLGVVTHCGPGRKDPETGERWPMYLQVGDKVLYGSYTGEELFMELDGVDLHAIREPDVMAVVCADSNL